MIKVKVKVKRHWKAWLGAAAIVIAAALGPAIPARAQASTPGLPSPRVSSASGKPWIVADPAAYSRAVKSGDWVYTPDGLAYKTCVSLAPGNSTITGDEIISPAGARQQIKPCPYPTLAYPGAGEPAQPSAVTPGSGPCIISSQPKFWAATCWESPKPLTRLKENYIVPTNPKKSGGLIFFWGGLQGASSSVIQNVLTWGANKGVVSNPKMWYVTPWYGYEGTFVHGKSIDVSAGQTIASTLTASKCSTKSVCTWLLAIDDLKNSRTASYKIVGHVSFPFLLGGVMEVPSVSGCTETPASGHAAFRSIQALESNGKIPTPAFGIAYPHKECGVTATASATAADIRWKP